MTDLLDDRYLEWLYSQVGSVKLRSKTRTYWGLLRQLYSKEFTWFIPNDDNRVEDGRELRYEFLDATGMQVDLEWLELGCSVLEMLIALSRRLSFEAEGSPAKWFWVLMENLQLDEFNDAVFKTDYQAEDINAALNTLIWRTYNEDGSEGGLFPLKHPDGDQRDVEIWYQQAQYVLENHL